MNVYDPSTQRLAASTPRWLREMVGVLTVPPMVVAMAVLGFAYGVYAGFRAVYDVLGDLDQAAQLYKGDDDAQDH